MSIQKLDKMLEKFRQAKAPEIARLRDLAAERRLPAPYEGVRPDFAAALVKPGRISVIAEYKRASPSKGDINLGIEPEQAAAGYAAAGAAALSVLTEEVYFKGRLDYLARVRTAFPDGPPLLRKDFILDLFQIVETAATPASALLLIARMLDAEHLTQLLAATAAVGLDAVVEVFDEADLAKARAAGSRIIQVNNRDLDTLTTDLGVSARLARSKAPGEIWISASGIAAVEELARMKQLGFEAALVGASLMAGEDPGRSLAALLRGA